MPNDDPKGAVPELALPNAQAMAWMPVLLGAVVAIAGLALLFSKDDDAGALAAVVFAGLLFSALPLIVKATIKAGEITIETVFAQKAAVSAAKTNEAAEQISRTADELEAYLSPHARIEAADAVPDPEQRKERIRAGLQNARRLTDEAQKAALALSAAASRSAAP